MHFARFPAHERGYTRKPEIRAILDCRERTYGPDYEGMIVHFEGLTFDEAMRIMEHLPPWLLEERQNESPTMREMVQLGSRFPGITFTGYRVPPDREDERINFEGFRIPKSETCDAEIAEMYEQLVPDLTLDMMDNGESWSFWWD